MAAGTAISRAKQGAGAGRPLAWLVPAVVTGGLMPLAMLVLRGSTGDLGANPIAEVLNQLGLAALILLVVSLACTPIKVLSGATWPIRVRKTLGLLAFFYALLHVLTYVVLDQQLALRTILEDVTKRGFIAVGFLAFVLLIPLAATSTSGMLKALGFKQWKRLHRLAYAAGVLGIVHFVWRVKKDLTEPLIYGAVLVILLAVRLLPERGGKAGRR